MFLLMFLKLGGADDIHSTGIPVLWKRGHNPVVIGFNAVIMNIKLVSPCDLLPIENVDSRVVNATIAQCEKAYEDLFLSKLEKMCPQETGLFGRGGGSRSS